MKNLITTILILLVSTNLLGQTFSTNSTPVGMEHNVLFKAQSRFKVTQTGNATLSLLTLFDGRFVPSYTEKAPTISDPTVILIENLPQYHTQLGAWVGWSTRHWPAKRFKIEGYDVFNNANTWKTIADYSKKDYQYSASRKFQSKLPNGRYAKLRFTFYTAEGLDGRLGVSELFYIHPEIVRPYQGLLGEEIWMKNGNTVSLNSGSLVISDKSSIHTHIQLGHDKNDMLITDNNPNKPYGGGYFFRVHNETAPHKYIDALMITQNGNIGIGTTDSKGYKLAIAGKAVAEEITIKLKSNWPDFVFDTNYTLPTLQEVEEHINEKGHLTNIPSAKEVKENGIEVGEMHKKLLQKIEELTLYTIQQQKELNTAKEKNNILEKRLSKLEKIINKIE